MKRKLQAIGFTFIMLTLLSSCNFVGNLFSYKDTTQEFLNDILKKDYDAAVKHFALEHPAFSKVNVDTLKSSLPAFHDLIVRNFGDHLNYTMMTAEKKWSTDGKENTEPGTTVVFMQIDNGKEFGVFKVWFDDNSKKILNIRNLEIREPVPNMTTFWLFGLLAICIPIFNIYMIVRVRRSNFKKKWLKYIAIILLNVPSIEYHAVSGASFEFLSFQILFGISFEYMGYLSTAWTFGIPLGGLVVWWKLFKMRNEPEEEITEAGTSLREPGNL